MVDPLIRFFGAAFRHATTGLAPALVAAAARAHYLPTGLTLPTPTIVDETTDAWVARRHVDKTQQLPSGALVVHLAGPPAPADGATEGTPYRVYPVAYSYVARVDSTALEHVALARGRYTLDVATRVALAAWTRTEAGVSGDGAITAPPEFWLREPSRLDVIEHEPFEQWGDAVLFTSRILPVAVLSPYGSGLV